MKLFKKIIMICLTFLMCFSFGACSGCTNGEGTKPVEPEKPGTEQPTPGETTEQAVSLSSIVGVYEPSNLVGENKTIRDRIYSEVADIIANALDKVYAQSITANKYAIPEIKDDSQLVDDEGNAMPYNFKRHFVFNGDVTNLNKNNVKTSVVNFLETSQEIYQTKFGLFDSEIELLFNFIKNEVIGVDAFNADQKLRDEIIANGKQSELVKPVLVKTVTKTELVNANGNQFKKDDEGFFYDPNSGIPNDDNTVNATIGETYTLIDSSVNINSATWSPVPASNYFNATTLKISGIENFKNYQTVLDVIKKQVETYLKNKNNIPGGTTEVSASGFLTAPIVEVEEFKVGYYEIDKSEDVGFPTEPLKVPYLYVTDSKGNITYTTRDFGDDNTNKYVLPERKWLTLYFCTTSKTQNHFWLLGIDAVIKSDLTQLSDSIKNYDVSITSKTQYQSFNYAGTNFKANITDFKKVNIDDLGEDVSDEVKDLIEEENKKYEGQYQFEINCFNKQVESNRAPKLGLTNSEAIFNSQGYRSQIKFLKGATGEISGLLSSADELNNTLAINFNTIGSSLSFKLERISFSFMYSNPDELDFSDQK